MNIEIMKIKLKGIADCVNKYTSEPFIANILESMEGAIHKNEYDIIIFTCSELLEWYKRNISEISNNEYVYNLDSHKRNILDLEGIISDLEKNLNETKQNCTKTSTEITKGIGLTEIELLIEKFHTVACQLRYRHNDRATVDINDEYDVQDLLHALLRIYFDDVREEECTPSYAGAYSRQDFLMKKEQIVIETKKTRIGLTNKKLSDELIIDIERYKKHPDCKKLVCFVYDPESRVKNPRGFENDLSRSDGELEVIVLVRP